VDTSLRPFGFSKSVDVYIYIYRYIYREREMEEVHDNSIALNKVTWTSLYNLTHDVFLVDLASEGNQHKRRYLYTGDQIASNVSNKSHRSTELYI
jgi:hypothetical protein